MNFQSLYRQWHAPTQESLQTSVDADAYEPEWRRLHPSWAATEGLFWTGCEAAAHAPIGPRYHGSGIQVGRST